MVGLFFEKERPASRAPSKAYWQMADITTTPALVDNIQRIYGIRVDGGHAEQLPVLWEALCRLPVGLVRSCGIKDLGFKDQGVSKEFYPNHGYYVDNMLVLNTQLVLDPQVFLDPSGRALDRFTHTLYHEMGHGFDDLRGDASVQEEWLSLSGWSKEPAAGLSRIVINEPGYPEMLGEWWYSAKAGFPRFYAKRNPWDDYADCFAFYVGGLKSFLPACKITYFDKALEGFMEP